MWRGTPPGVAVQQPNQTNDQKENKHHGHDTFLNPGRDRVGQGSIDGELINIQAGVQDEVRVIVQASAREILQGQVFDVVQGQAHITVRGQAHTPYTRSKSVLAPSPERVAIMQWTARIGAVTAEALADRLDVNVASARGRLQALQKAGWLSRQRPLAAAAGAIYGDASRSARGRSTGSRPVSRERLERPPPDRVRVGRGGAGALLPRSRGARRARAAPRRARAWRRAGERPPGDRAGRRAAAAPPRPRALAAGRPGHTGRRGRPGTPGRATAALGCLSRSRSS